MDDLTRDFASDTLDALDLVERDVMGAARSESPALFARVFRLLHTIKGTCGFLALPRLEAMAHAGEDRLAALERDGRAEPLSILPLLEPIRTVLADLIDIGSEPVADAAGIGPAGAVPHIQVPAERIEQLFANVAELGQISRRVAAVVRHDDNRDLRAPVHDLAQVAARIETQLARMTMQPVDAAWRHAPRVVRQIAEAEGKAIRVERTGGDTHVDRRMFGVLRDVVVHLVRNAAAHGIEPCEERRRLGKPEQGLIRMSARLDAGRIHFVLSDDGRGFDPERPVAPADGGPVTRISGRGIGLSAVQARIKEAGGTMSIASSRDTGTRFEISLPATLTLAPCLMVQVGGARYALPQAAVLEVVRLNGATVVPAEVTARSGSVPVVDLAAALGVPAAGSGFAVVCEAGGRRFGLRVDGFGECEALALKPLPIASARPLAFHAAAIAADGAVVLVLDVRHFATAGTPALPAVAPALAEPKVPLLAFSAADAEPRLVRLADVKRVCLSGEPEKIPVRVIPASPDLGQAGPRAPVLVLDGPEGDIGLAVQGVGEVQHLDAALLPPAGEDAPGYAPLEGTAGSNVHVLNPAGFLRDHLALPRRNGVLLIEADPFCRALLQADLEAAGHAIVAPEPEDGLPRGARFAAAVIDLDSDETVAMLLAGPQAADRALTRIGTSARRDAVVTARARRLGVATIVGKFDRVALRRGLGPAATPEVAA